MAKLNKNNDANKEKALAVRKLFVAFNDEERIKWRGKSSKSYDFYLGEQLTKEEQTALEESGMPTFVINMVTPAVEIMTYFLTANNPKWKAIGVDGSDSDIAEVHSDISDYSWNLSNGKSIYAQIIKDALTKSKGYMLVYVDPDDDYGMGEVKFDFVDPWDVYVDPMSRDLFERDASAIIIKKDLPKEMLKLKLPNFVDEIEKASGGTDTKNYSNRDRNVSMSHQMDDFVKAINAGSGDISKSGEEDEMVGYYECYRKITVPYVNVFMVTPPSQAEIEQVREIVKMQIIELQRELEIEFLEKKQELIQMAQSGQIIKERLEYELQKMQQEIQNTLAEREQQLFSKAQEEASKVEQKILPESEYKQLIKNKTIEKLIVDAIPYNEPKILKTVTCGLDTFLYEELLNLRDYPIVKLPYLHTGTPNDMSMIAMMIGKQQEINKAHQIMIHNANLSSNVRWLVQEGQIDDDEWDKYSSAPGARLTWRDTGSGQAPIPIQPLPLNNAFFSITEKGQRDIEYLSGVQSSSMGVVDRQPDTYRGMLANDEFGTRRIRQWMNNVIEPFLEQVGGIFRSLAQQIYTVHKVFRIVQPTAGSIESRSVEINIPIYNDYGEAIGKWKDYETARFDIRLVAGSTLPLNRWALLEEYFRWFQAGIIDDIHFLSETDIRNKEQLVERKSMYSQMKSQIAQLEEAIKSKDGDIQTLHRQLLQKNIENDSMKLSEQMKEQAMQTKAQQKYYRDTLKKDFDIAKKEYDVDKKMVKEDVKNIED